ncbi:MAG: helix-turn-helix domain-containing protein [Desulfovibrionaceae bacterium]|nr:helix-turn-helix domain-containing protein [Desulfovibrionaceae bacterium]
MEEYPHLSEALALVLRRRREGLGLSKLRMSEETRLERAYITSLERGDKRPTLNAVFFLCDALKMSRRDFLAELEAEMERLKARAGEGR